MAATNAARSTSFIGAAHRGRLARMEKGKAIKATAHQLGRLIHALLTRGEEYTEKGIQAYEDAREARNLQKLQRRAAKAGYILLPASDAALS